MKMLKKQIQLRYQNLHKHEESSDNSENSSF